MTATRAVSLRRRAHRAVDRVFDPHVSCGRLNRADLKAFAAAYRKPLVHLATANVVVMVRIPGRWAKPEAPPIVRIRKDEWPG